jgi:hypothetical protein
MCIAKQTASTGTAGRPDRDTFFSAPRNHSKGIFSIKKLQIRIFKRIWRQRAHATSHGNYKNVLYDFWDAHGRRHTMSNTLCDAVICERALQGRRGEGQQADQINKKTGANPYS